MNDIKLSNVNFSGSVNTDNGKTAASAPPPTAEAQNGNANASTAKAAEEVSKIQSLTDARLQENGQNQEVQQEKLEDAVTKLNDYIQSVQRNLEFNVDDDSGKTVVKVVDRNTNEVVRQIPDEQALKMAQNLQQDEPLSLFTMKV